MEKSKPGPRRRGKLSMAELKAQSEAVDGLRNSIFALISGHNFYSEDRSSLYEEAGELERISERIKAAWYDNYMKGNIDGEGLGEAGADSEGG